MKKLLKEKFQEKVITNEEENHLNLEKTEFWISSDIRELTIGLGFNHIHYNFEYDSMEDAIDTFFYLLTRKKKITNYRKGNRIFKTKVEIEFENENPIDLGSVAFISLQFWKKTNIQITYEDEYITTEKVLNEWKELINYAKIQNNVH